ncbi:ADP-ribosylglycohydrolase [Anaeramoeba ignava]|uniref:ADP-ribosylglycohydrolase n=1 Tax=Anaeramoeba ignava TaxID=1746090 RepID=A0A9Q0LGT1_ANAIG|nr:ADP-ribosylglycohydrolase [Anaeramoeba ignava]
MGNSEPKDSGKEVKIKYKTNEKNEIINVDLSRIGKTKIPIEICNEIISHKPPIQILNLGFNQLSSHQIFFDLIFKLKELRVLKINNNFFSSLPKGLTENLPKLEILDISNNSLSQFDEESNFPNLTHFYARRSSLSIIPDCILNSTNIRFIDLKKNSIYELSKNFENLTNLEHINLSSNRIQKVELNLKKLSKLQTLNLAYNSISNFRISEDDENQLSEIDLSHNRFNSFPKSILSLKKIKKLDLSDNEVSIPDEIQQLTSLEILRWNSNKISTIPKNIANLKDNLKELWLRYNPFREFPKELLELKSINLLDLTGTKLKEIPDEISTQLPNLERIYLAYNQLKEIPNGLKKLQKPLKRIWLDNNPMNENDTKIVESGMKKLLNYLFPLRKEEEKEIIIENSNNSNNLDEKQEIIIENSNDSNEKNEIIIDSNEKKDIIINLDEKDEKNESFIVMPKNATKLSIEELKDKIRGTIIGNCIGDAVGLATEFLDKYTSSYNYDFEYFDYEKFLNDGHRSAWIEGDWTDDSDQMLLILDGILANKGKVIEQDFAKRLVHWIENGFREVGDSDWNGSWRYCLHLLLNRLDFWKIHIHVQKTFGKEMNKNAAANGAVMRTSVLGIPNFHDLQIVHQNALKIGKVTHYDSRCRASCIATTSAIALMLQGEDDIQKIIQKSIEFGEKEFEQKEYENESRLKAFQEYMNMKSWSELKLDEPRKIGYTLKAVGSGFFALRSLEEPEDFSQLLTEMTMEAGDADTNGAVVGALLGCRIGYSKIPEQWKRMPHLNWVNYKIDQLFKLMKI